MAESSIVLKIGSQFSGEGLQKLQEGVKEANSHVSKGIAVTGQLASALSGLDSSASRCASATSGLLQAFAQGGVSGAAFAAVMMSVQSYVSNAKEAIAALNQETEQLEAKLAKGFSETLAANVSAAVSRITDLRTEFEKTAAVAESVTKAFNNLDTSNAQATVIKLATDKLNATLNETDAQMRQVIAAGYDVQIAEANLAEAERQGAESVKAAKTAWLTNQQRISTIEEQVAEIDNEIAVRKKEAANLRIADEKKAAEVEKKVSELVAKRETIVKELSDAQSKTTKLEVEYHTASQNARNEIQKKENALTESVAAEKELKAALEDRQKNEANAAALAADEEKEAAERKAAGEDLAKAREEEKEASEKAAKATEKVKTAQEELVSAINAYNKNLVQNELTRIINDSRSNDTGKTLTNYMGNILRQMGVLSAKAADVAGKAGIANGEIKTVAELNRVQNQAARDARIQMKKIAAQQAQEAQRAARLEKMSSKAISDADAKWLKQYKELQEQKNAAAKRVRDANNALKKAQQDRDKQVQAAKNSEQSLKDILAKLSSLGLK